MRRFSRLTKAGGARVVRVGGRVGAAAAAMAVLAAAPSARADSYIATAIFGGMVGVPLAAVGAVAGLVVGTSNADGGRPSRGARVFALTAGALNAGYGVFLLGSAIRWDYQGMYLFAGLDLAVGVTDIALTLYRASRPRRVVSGAAWSVTPMATTDAAGQPVAGAALRLVAF